MNRRALLGAFAAVACSSGTSGSASGDAEALACSQSVGEWCASAPCIRHLDPGDHYDCTTLTSAFGVPLSFGWASCAGGITCLIVDDTLPTHDWYCYSSDELVAVVEIRDQADTCGGGPARLDLYPCKYNFVGHVCQSLDAGPADAGRDGAAQH